MKANILEENIKTTLKDNANMSQSGNNLGVNGRSKRNASKRKYDYDDFLDETSYSKAKKKTRNNGKIQFI